MYPDRNTALAALAEAEERTPGAWGDHSRYTAEAAERIAARCPGMDRKKAYVCGLLHDIGRREGVFALRRLFW